MGCAENLEDEHRPYSPTNPLIPADSGDERKVIHSAKEETVAICIERLNGKVLVTAEIYKRINKLINEITGGNTVDKVVGIILSEHKTIKDDFVTTKQRKIRV